MRNKVEEVRPRAIFTTAETLLPTYRKTIETAFHCEVIDCYGCYDGGPQAIECPSHEGYHISVEKVVMEFVDEAFKAVMPGSAGEILATDLHNYAMPFVRYSVGDLGVPGKETCTCGRGLPLMQSVQGRTLDFIILPNGNRVRGLRLIDVFYEHMHNHDIRELTTIRQFQIVQKKKDLLVIRLVQDLPVSAEEKTFIKNKLLNALSFPMEIQFELVNHIEDSKNGKRQYVVSLVDE